MDKYLPEADKGNNNSVYGYVVAQTMVQLLKQCGDELTRQNVMKQAANLKNFSTDMMLPGITIDTGADDFFPIEQMRLMQFDGEAWRMFGDVIASPEVGLERPISSLQSPQPAVRTASSRASAVRPSYRRGLLATTRRRC